MNYTLFSIAVSSNGTIGLITSQGEVDVTYPERTVKAWTGVIIEDNTFQSKTDPEQTIHAKVGGFWSSSNPKIIGFISPAKLVELLATESQVKWREITEDNQSRLTT